MNKQVVKAKDIAEQYELSVRTVYRYIDVLMDAGVPIEKVRGANGGIRIDGSYKINSMYLTKSETDLAINAIVSYNSAIKNEDLKSVVSKLLALKSGNAQNLSALDGRLYVDGGAWGVMNSIEEYLPMVQRAVYDSYHLNLLYVDRDGAVSSRDVEPHALVFKEGMWYFYAFCNLRNAFRLFKVSRIRSLTETNDKFVRREVDEEILNKEVGYARFGELSDVLFEVKRERRALVEEWLGVNCVTEEDGVIYAKAKLPCDRDTAERLLAFSDGVKVLKPKKLGDMIADLADQILSRYK